MKNTGATSQYSTSMPSSPVATVRAFYLRQPRWRTHVFLRLFVILIAILTVIFFAVAIAWEGVLLQRYIGYFSRYYVNWLPFVPVSLTDDRRVEYASCRIS